MEPLSITAACAGILGSIAPLAFKITNFAVGVREARKEMLSIDQELSTLSMFIKILKNDCKDPAYEYPRTLRESIVDVLEHCAGVIAEMDAIVDKFASGNFRRRLQWEALGRDGMQKLRERLNVYSGHIGRYLELLSLLQNREVKHDTANILQHVELIGEQTEIIRNNTAYLPQMQHDLSRISSQLPLIAEMLRSQAPVLGTTREEIEDNIILRRFIDETCSYAETIYDEVTTRASVVSEPSEKHVSQSRGVNISKYLQDEEEIKVQITGDTFSVLSEEDAQSMWANFAAFGFNDTPVERFSDALISLPLDLPNDHDSAIIEPSTSSAIIQNPELPVLPNTAISGKQKPTANEEIQHLAHISDLDLTELPKLEVPGSDPKEPTVLIDIEDEEEVDSKPSPNFQRLPASYEEYSDTESDFGRGRSPTPRPTLFTETLDSHELMDNSPEMDTFTESISGRDSDSVTMVPDINTRPPSGQRLENIASEPNQIPERAIHRNRRQSANDRSPRNQNLIYDPNTRSFRPEAELRSIEMDLRESIQNTVNKPVRKKGKRKSVAKSPEEPNMNTQLVHMEIQHGASRSHLPTKVNRAESIRSSIRSQNTYATKISSDGESSVSEKRWSDKLSMQDGNEEIEAGYSRNSSFQSPRKSSFKSTRKDSFQSFRSLSGAKVTFRQVPVVELPHLSIIEKSDIRNILTKAGFLTQGTNRPKTSVWSWSKNGSSKERAMSKALVWAVNVYSTSNRTIKKVATEKIVQYLINNGADVNTTAISTYSYTPGTKSKHNVPILHITIRASLREVAETLIVKGAELDARDWMQRTALHLAAENDLWEIILLLSSKGANIHAEDFWGHNTLHIAAVLGKYNAVRVIISVGGDANASGLLADVAAQGCATRVLTFLLEQGADPNDRDKSQKSALYRAVENILIENAEVLLEFGADPREALYLAQNRNRWEVRGRDQRIADQKFVRLLSTYKRETVSRPRRSVSFSSARMS